MITLLREFLQRRNQTRLQNIELTVFILERTVESHAAVIDHPEFSKRVNLKQK